MSLLSFMRIEGESGDVQLVNPTVIARIYQAPGDKKSMTSTIELVSGSKITLEGSPEDLALRFASSNDCPPIRILTKLNQKRAPARS